ncbi:1,6-anhydro-N-acetylmuramyl-L-alanine amidase AmpD [Xylophilus ampelinus]|uniref:1,6-anhydro-N-acetylmuramyl-L-alanine amidase AmpD n=1 Tax=Xylophilus ampelinus TaxID=54067 RepID=A0A318SIL9_9BURK|nr:1,6-anhydro-N-acetylmuramyl-L-alanine amidase AmpD [Xylophilus ampelinus]MCS4509677.1 1,6-anhydro-N-acetylmuramyl-L-alanine amidase AmpD [Xylophilus ampelinus]PYE78837.1 AmpD protein [Xylophilus ampelinus]
MPPADAGAGAPGPWDGGWYRPARRFASPNFGLRPAGAVVDLAVVHSISLPPGVYGGDEVFALFGNTLDCDAHPYFDRLRGVEVSAHFYIRRDGALWQFVDCDARAWHAGRSAWRGRDNCNDDSVGIELEGLEGDRFEPAQYTALAALCAGLRERYPVRYIAGHCDIAPGRKHDPGPGFDWQQLNALLPPASLALPLPVVAQSIKNAND